MSWQTPKTDWTAADGVRNSDMNRIEGNALELYNTKAELSEFEALRTHVDNSIFAIARKTAIGNLVAGTEFGLYENGILIPFIKLKSDYAGTGRDLVVRKDAYRTDILFNTSDTVYANCRQDTWLNGTYKLLLDSLVQSAIADVQIQAAAGSGTVNINRGIFLLSLYEYGQTSSAGAAALGERVAYFNSNARRIARYNGNIVPHWTRTVGAGSPLMGAYIDESGDGSGSLVRVTAFAAGIRPAFTLPTNFEVLGSIPSTNNVMATAEVI